MTDQTQPIERRLDSDDIERRLDSDEAVSFLNKLGYRVAKATLNKYVSVGGGPAYEKFGRARKYTGSGLLAWVASKSRAPQRNSSEQQAAA
jgi:hypothetical protein